MGMDVFGLKPKSNIGEYFRNNVWWWHPLWDFCDSVAPEICNKVESAHYNSGDGLNAIDSRKLAFLIKEQIKTGAAQQYVDDYYAAIEQLPLENCYCTKSQKSLFESYVSDGSIPFPKTEEYIDPNPECKICSGSGKMKNFASSYHISLENIEKFSNFLMDCGGFQIC